MKTVLRLCHGSKKWVRILHCPGTACIVKGVETLKGSEVYGEDLRGTAALIIAGLAAQETTVIHDADYILRGYMDLCENLKGLGAEIEWENS